MRKIKFDGPTYFAPLIAKCREISSANPTSYLVFLILTDGEINDIEDTIDGVVLASALPISIVIVGVGFEKFSSMQKLDADVNQLRSRAGELAKRDIVQFVSFRDYENNVVKLATETIKEIPRQFMKYAELVNLPLAATKPTTSILDARRNELIENLQKEGCELTNINHLLKDGCPIDDPEEIKKAAKSANYVNPLK